MQNCEYFRPTEVVGSLIALSLVKDQESNLTIPQLDRIQLGRTSNCGKSIEKGQESTAKLQKSTGCASRHNTRPNENKNEEYLLLIINREMG